MLKGQLEQTAGLLDQQVDLGTGECPGECSEVATECRWESSASITPPCASLGSLWSYLIQRHIPDGRAIDFQDPVSNVDGILHIWAHAAGVHSGDKPVVKLVSLPLMPFSPNRKPTAKMIRNGGK